MEKVIMFHREPEEIPIWEKPVLTIKEAVAYTNIGEGKIRKLLNNRNCSFVLFIGCKMLVKRIEFEEFLERELTL